jgi:hypothetical protein
MLCYKDSCSSAPEAHSISLPVHEFLKEFFLENDPQEHCHAAMTDLDLRLAQPSIPRCVRACPRPNRSLPLTVLDRCTSFTL